MESSDASRRRRILFSALAGIIAFVILTLLVLPSPWAPLAGLVLASAASASTYGMLAGAQPKADARELEQVSTPQLLSERLHQLRKELTAHAAKLPPDALNRAEEASDSLAEIIHRWSTLDSVPEQQDAVYATVTRHFPRTIELFLALPDSVKPRHADELREQVRLVAEAAATTRDVVVAKDLRQLRAQTLLLEESLTDPDEKLFKNEGL